MSYSYERFFNPDCDVEGKPSEDENEDEMTAFDELELKKMQEFMATIRSYFQRTFRTKENQKNEYCKYDLML